MQIMPVRRAVFIAREMYCQMQCALALGLNTDTAEPKDAFEMLAALAVSGGGSGDVGELEDTTFEIGSFVNSGAGWNTFKFREAFDAAPQVVCQAEDFDGIVQVKSSRRTGFCTVCGRFPPAVTTPAARPDRRRRIARTRSSTEVQPQPQR